MATQQMVRSRALVLEIFRTTDGEACGLADLRQQKYRKIHPERLRPIQPQDDIHRIRRGHLQKFANRRRSQIHELARREKSESEGILSGGGSLCPGKQFRDDDPGIHAEQDRQKLHPRHQRERRILERTQKEDGLP